MVPTRKKSKLLPTSQTAFSSVTRRAVTRINIDIIHTQSTICTSVIRTVIDVWKISISIKYEKLKLHDCLKRSFSERAPRGNNKIEVKVSTYQSNSVLQFGTSKTEVKPFTYQSNMVLQCNPQSSYTNNY